MKMALSVILTGLLPLAGFATPSPDCGTSAHAQELALLIMGHASQQRTELQCSELLAKVAAQRAQYLVEGPEQDKKTPNEVLIENGFKFPSFYPPVGNQVEAVASELVTPESALDYLVRSYQHRDLVLGDGEFFSRQTQMGVGYYVNEHDQSQWVVLIAEPYTSPRIVIKHEFEAPKTITVESCGKTWRSSRNAELRRVCRERWLKEKGEGD